MAYRNRKLLDLAHEMPCQADFDHRCQGQVVPCHSNQLLFGRGASFKSPDCFFAACCGEAHDFLDGRRGGWDKETKHAEWLRAYIKTQEYLWKEGLIRVA